MPFIVEKIPEHIVKKQNAESIGFNLNLSTYWAIDVGRNAFIVLNNKIGGSYEGTQQTKYYTLAWHDKLVRIAANPLTKTFTEQGAIMSWCIHDIKIPHTLSNQEEDLLQLIKDAFSAVGDAFDGDRFTKVNVIFQPSATA